MGGEGGLDIDMECNRTITVGPGGCSKLTANSLHAHCKHTASSGAFPSLNVD